MLVLTCKECFERKMETDFYAHKKAKNGRFSSCKECVKQRVTNRRWENIDKIREYDRERGRLPHRLERNKERNRLMPSRSPRPWRERNPEKYRAHLAVCNAVRDGKLVRQTNCERCNGVYMVQAHHEDYSEQLDVMWLCKWCHGERHRELNEMKRQQLTCEAAE